MTRVGEVNVNVSWNVSSLFPRLSRKVIQRVKL